MSKDKYYSLEEARKENDLKEFAKAHPKEVRSSYSEHSFFKEL